MSRLTDKQEMFCLEYLTDLNATQAAMRAGYSKSTAMKAGRDILAHPCVRERIAELKAMRVADLKADANYVLKRLLEVDSLDVADILDTNGNLLPIHEWSKAWRISVSAIDIAELKKTDETETYVKKIKIPDKVKNLELLGKHTDISAFKDKVEVTGRNGTELIINVTSPQTKDGLQKLRDSLQDE